MLGTCTVGPMHIADITPSMQVNTRRTADVLLVSM